MQKTTCKTFHRKTYFAEFCEFDSNFSSNIFWGNRFSFLTRYRQVELKLFEDLTQQTFIGLEDVLKPSSRHVLKTSLTRLQRNNFSSSNPSSRHLGDVFEDEKFLRWRRFQDVFKTCLQDVLKTYLQDIFKTSWKQKMGISVSKKSKWVCI